MMKRTLLYFFCLAPMLCFGQYTESFNIADKGVDPVTPFTTNLSGVNWSMALGTYVGTVSATPQYAKAVSGALEFRNTDKEVCFTSPYIGINTPPGPRTIAIDFDVTGIDVEDWIQVLYSVNQGAYIPLANQSGGGANTVGVTGVGQNANLSGTITASGITGNNLKIRICATSSNTTELIKILEIRVPETGSIVLPVTWDKIEAKQLESGNEIKWSTFSEINNSHFEVERSISNEEEFEYIGRVEGNGNTKTKNEYKFIDYNGSPRSSNVYYRVKQVDYDGKYEYSSIVSVKQTSDKIESVSPNPFQNQLTIYTNIADQTQGNLTITDLQGHLIKDIKTIDESDDSITFDTSEFLPGVYFVKFPSGKVSRIIKN